MSLMGFFVAVGFVAVMDSLGITFWFRIGDRDEFLGALL